jgi:hypothetical protein
LNASDTATSAPSLPRPEDCAALLVEALSPSARATARLALAWGLPHPGQNSPVDLVVQNRRQLAFSDSTADRARLRLIDTTIARAWPLALDLWVADLGSEPAAQVVQSLAWLSKRIPSPDIHSGLFAAMLQAGTHLSGIASPEEREKLRATLANDLHSAWMQTLDRASRAQIEGVLTSSHLFTPLDKFDIWVWAWRFGIDRAVDVAGALAATCATEEAALPLGSPEDRDYLAELVAGTSIGCGDAGYRAMVESLFATLRQSRSTEAWGIWLGSVFARLPDANWLMDMTDDADAVVDPDLAAPSDSNEGDDGDWDADIDPAWSADVSEDTGRGNLDAGASP